MSAHISFRRRLQSACVATLGFIAAVGLVAPNEASATPHRPAKAHIAKPADGKFIAFVESLWPLAQAEGVSRATFDAAFKGVVYDGRIVANTEGQAEFVRPVWAYINSAVSSRRIERGQGRAGEQAAWLKKAQSTYGVDEATIMGIWGVETEFGAFSGNDRVIQALASLAYVHSRGDYFRDELIAALTILEHGDIAPTEMRGSWAGAMGQTQFMPSSYLKFAVDFDGDGRRDIWKDYADAIGSTGNYLTKHGWKSGERWGYEVRLPENFRLTAEDSRTYAPISGFAERSVARVDGKSLPGAGEGKFLMPAGLHGPIFLITPNFDVIKTYNNSTSYALAVSLLGDAIVRGDRLQSAWPVKDGVLSKTQAKELQTRLAKMGYEVGKIDGVIGESVRGAIRAYQEKSGLPPDGYATAALFKRLHDAK